LMQFYQSESETPDQLQQDCETNSCQEWEQSTMHIVITAIITHSMGQSINQHPVMRNNHVNEQVFL
jgi:hypothetical protein